MRKIDSLITKAKEKTDNQPKKINLVYVDKYEENGNFIAFCSLKHCSDNSENMDTGKQTFDTLEQAEKFIDDFIEEYGVTKHNHICIVDDIQGRLIVDDSEQKKG